MVQINFALREVNCKIVYYGPGLSGKTTNLEIVHKKAPSQNRGELTSIATEGDRTLFFDFMPLDLGTVAGMRTKFQLYTVPGQVYYNSTRKLVLQGTDGIIFVADSSPSKLEENLESWENLRENLAEYGRRLEDVPVVIQYNKRDLPDALDIRTLDERVNKLKVPTFEAVAITGEGVFPTLKSLSSLVLESLNKGDREDRAPAAVAVGATEVATASAGRAAAPAMAPAARAPAEAKAQQRAPEWRTPSRAPDPPATFEPGRGRQGATSPEPKSRGPAAPARRSAEPGSRRAAAARTAAPPLQKQKEEGGRQMTWLLFAFLVLAVAGAVWWLFKDNLVG